MAKKIVLQPFFVSFGAEGYFLDQDLERARGWKDRTMQLVDGEDITADELVSLLETRGFEDLDRVVILDNAQKVKESKALKRYIEDKNPTDGTSVLVALVRAEKLPEIWNTAAKKGRLSEHRKLKTWDGNNEVLKWISLTASRLEMTLDTGAADMVYQLVGADLYRLSNELEKLQLLAGKGKKVGIEHVKAVLAPSPSAEPWQVAEAVVEKDARKAMNTLSLVYRNMGEDAHVPVTFSLIKQVEKLLVARQLLDQQASEEEIAAAVGMHPWRCKTYFVPHVRKHSFGALISCLGGLRKLDQMVKGPARSKRTRVELMVLSITG